MQLRWSHAVLYVRDIEEMIRFYRDVLGFQVSDRGPLHPANPALEIAFLSQVGSDHHQLAFVPVRGGDATTPLDHFAFRVDSLADVKTVAERLQADGRAADLNPLNHGNAWSVYFKDPEGNGLEVFCDSPWGVRQPQGKPWDLSLSEEALRRQTEAQFKDEPGFRPIAEFYADHRRRLGEA
jgi:catechol 2,3-dioxygenase-like lactoylglutathione lyase family enzyme